MKFTHNGRWQVRMIAPAVCCYFMFLAEKVYKNINGLLYTFSI